MIMMPATENSHEESPLLGTPEGVPVTTTVGKPLLAFSSASAAANYESTSSNINTTTATMNTSTITISDANNNADSKGNDNDEYIISLIRRTSILNNDDNNGNDGIRTTDSDDDDDDDELHGTTYGQTVVHLVKGYIACGILSLPWAISQLGIPLGFFAIVLMAVWSSYNCWTVVKVKRYIERTTINRNDIDGDDDDDDDSSDSDEDEDNNSDVDAEAEADGDDDTRSKTSRISRAGTASSVASSNVTYPDVGEWAHGAEFQKYVAICVCAQQLAICTVLISFVGENVFATLRFLEVGQQFNRMMVTTFCMPAFLAMSCFLPTLKSLSPFMLMGTILMLSGFATLGLIGILKWNDRPMLDELPQFKWDKNAPMALCGILYSFEGICIILPVESSMKHPKKEFKSAFSVSMVIITMILSGMAVIGVLVFGEVSNGSITAFLLEEYKNDPKITLWLMLSNALVSASIVVSYPLQLFPAVELIAPKFYNWTAALRRRQRWWWNYARLQQRKEDNEDGSSCDEDDDGEGGLGYTANGDDDLEGFEPMAGIPEHSVASMRSLPSLPESTYHEYETNNTNAQINDNHDGVIIDPSRKGMEVATSSSPTTAEPNADNETTKTGEATDGGGISESASLLSRLSSNVSYQQSIVDGDDIDDDGIMKNTSEPRHINLRDSDFEWSLPGDSPGLRAGLVIGTYLVAMVVPNVQSLVSLVGAVTGSSTALLIPPILELALIRHMELREAGRQQRNYPLGDWEGGPSTASKRTLFGTSYHNIDLRHSTAAAATPKNKKRRKNRYFWDKVLSWFLLIIGSLFALVGSYFSIRDIIESYM